MKENGVAICSVCQAEILADKESRRECPDDGSLMDKRIVKGIVTDHCPRCGGVWLDPGELELLNRAISQSRDSGWINGYIIGMSAGMASG
jgi:predicted RNA-binding Zn-ribbon protein involved in translation (DUF1610 family)